MTESDPPAPETSQTLDRGLAILEAVSQHPAGLSMSELAKLIGVSRSIIYRLVATLEARDLVTRASGRVRMGSGVLRWHLAVRSVLVEAARPVLRALSDALGATAHLTVADGEWALALAVVEPNSTDFYVTYRVGARHPLDRGSAGRAILAGRSGNASPVASVGELQPGAHGLSAPILDVPGLEGSVGVISMEAKTERAAQQTVTDAALQIARAVAGTG